MQLQEETRNNKVMGFVASYIRGLSLVKVSLQQIEVIQFIRLLQMHVILKGKGWCDISMVSCQKGPNRHVYA